jgi:hypothetical protein
VHTLVDIVPDKPLGRRQGHDAWHRIVALGLWILNVAGALAFDFHHLIVDHFFWASAAILLVLIAAIALSDTPSAVPKMPPSPG